jgi:hypothetical protein
MSCAEAPSPSRLTSNTPEVVCSTSGTLGPAPVPTEGWMAETEGLAGSELAEGLTSESWWLQRLPIASSPCGPGFFHEVGAKLLVEIRPKGGRRHNSPLIIPLPFEGKRPEAPLGSGWRNYSLVTAFAPLPILHSVYFYFVTSTITKQGRK